MRVAYPLVGEAAGGLATYLLARLLATAEAWFMFSASPVAKVATPAAVAAVVTSATTLDVPNVNRTRSPAVSPTAESFTACAPVLPVGEVQFALVVPGSVKVTVVVLEMTAV